MTDPKAPVVLVVEHEPACPPAHFGTWLEEAGAVVAVARPWAGEEVPALAAYDALLVMGGSMGANDDDTTPWLGAVKERVREAAAIGLPTLGICLGHQLVAVALGGSSERNAAGQQVGLYDVGWTDAATDDDLVSAVTGRRRSVQWNSDVVTELPEGAVVLAATAEGELQAARFGERVWGVQFHPEVDEPLVRSWAAGDRDDHLEKGIDQEAVLAEIDTARGELDEAWRPLASRFAEIARRAR
ncbi:type 1 glutamine amidotransferase [Nocardioides sp. GCM10027113]|uniref:type 1 glutamine amidotransferase n=1 Tax=unclassified Nocardioides TaxID=2615069 RepID=UPI003619B89F